MTFLALTFTEMLTINLDNFKAFTMPKAKEILRLENGSFYLSDAWFIYFTSENNTSPEDLKSIQAQILNLEERLERRNQLETEEIEQIQSDIKKLENEFQYKSQPYYTAREKCFFNNEWEILEWISVARASWKHTTRQVAYATGRRPTDNSNTTEAFAQAVNWFTDYNVPRFTRTRERI